MLRVTHTIPLIVLFITGLGVSTSAEDTGTFTATANSIAQLRAAATKGDKEAENRLGTFFSNGEATPFVPRDDDAALSWWQKAADQGQRDAAFSLGISYIYSFDGLAQDQEKGLKWLRLAADKGNANAQYFLGVSYVNGKYVAKDTKEALKWLHKAAEQDSPRAEAALGALYANGDGIEPNQKEAVKWTKKAVEHGIPNGQFNLGQYYYQGHGVVKDHTMAVTWWRKAADRGYFPAEVRLADAYAKGDGIAKDDVQAYMWYEIALRTVGDTPRLKHSRAAKELIAKEMTAKEIADAKKMASDWQVQFLATYGILTDSNWMFAQFKDPRQ
jgi:TPR repeat protein